VRAQAVLKNWIDNGELPAVWLGARRVRVRESDLDAFVAASEMRRKHLDAGDPWAQVYEAAKATLAATMKQDREALDRAIANLADAAQEIPRPR
jgi:hypothetical protein